jgi:hemerythrin-like domain-containing protein
VAQDLSICAPTEANCRAIDPIRLLQEDNALRLDLCDLLEHIADSLPENAAPQLAQLASTALERGWANHVAFEEQALFPLLSRHRRKNPDLLAGLDQLALEHAADSSLDQELVDTLDDLARGGPPDNPEMVGYLLRAHFVPMRRHILWENAFLIPAARRLLSSEDISLLRDWIRTREPDKCTCGALE